jgi:hypothetical protein
VDWDRGLLAPTDRPEAIRTAATTQGAGDRIRTTLERALGGLGKLPWVEGVAIRGPMAWGQWDGNRPVEVVLLAEGGRAAHADAAAALWLRVARSLLPPLRLLPSLDADAMGVRSAGLPAAASLQSVLPVTHAAAWDLWWAANTWLVEAYPGHAPSAWAGRLDLGAGGPVDGRLARWRRGVVSRGEGLLRSADRTLPRWLAWEDGWGGAAGELPTGGPDLEERLRQLRRFVETEEGPPSGATTTAAEAVEVRRVAEAAAEEPVAPAEVVQRAAAEVPAVWQAPVSQRRPRKGAGRPTRSPGAASAERRRARRRQ